MAGKMSPKFVALCSLAIGAIYSTGYAITNSSAAAAVPTSQQSQSAATGNPNGSSGQSQSGGASGGAANGAQGSGSAGSSSASSHSNASTASTKSTNTTQKYLDGTYNGSAANQIGAVSVAVSIQKGKIANVQITACDTHYPQSYIDPVLPDYVVSNQSTNIPVVSGATLSTEDFYYAVVQALSQAQNPHYKG